MSVMTGARAKIKVAGNYVGIFEACSYGANLGTEPVHTLGRYSPNEITITSYEAVQVQCSGFRIVDQGVHVLPAAPKLQDLLNFESVQLEVEDRQTGKMIAIVKNCVPSNWSEQQNAKGTTRFNITYIGTTYSDETSQDEVESAGASELP
jgi:hypothetical protein